MCNDAFCLHFCFGVKTSQYREMQVKVTKTIYLNSCQLFMHQNTKMQTKHMITHYLFKKLKYVKNELLRCFPAFYAPKLRNARKDYIPLNILFMCY